MAETKKGTFKVGEAYGTVINKEFDFEYREFADMNEVAASADWTPKNLLDLVNAQEKSNARANRYQQVTAPYRPDPNAPETIRERMIKDAQKLGKTEAEARAFVESLLGAAAH